MENTGGAGSDGVTWTIETLRRYLEMRLSYHEQLADERQAAWSEATQRLAADYDTRFASVNEFRAQQAELIAKFLPRAEFDRAHQAVVEQLADLSRRINLQAGQETGEQQRAAVQASTRNQIILLISVLVAGIGVLTGLIVAFRG